MALADASLDQGASQHFPPSSFTLKQQKIQSVGGSLGEFFLAQLRMGKDIRGIDDQPRNESKTKEKDVFLLFLNAQGGQEIWVGSQKGVSTKTGDRVEEIKVRVQLHLATLPCGGSVTLDE